MKIINIRETFNETAMNDVPLLTIAQLLGHKDIKMTQRYSHLTSQHKADAVQLEINKFASRELQDS